MQGVGFIPRVAHFSAQTEICFIPRVAHYSAQTEVGRLKEIL